MARQNWDRVSREGRIAAARDHEERMAEEIAADASLGPAPRGLQQREVIDLTTPLEGSWWRVPTAKWRDFRRVMQYLLRHRRPLLIIGPDAGQQVFITVDGPTFVVRLAALSVEASPILGRNTTTCVVDDDARAWWEARDDDRRSAAGSVSGALQASGVISPSDLRLTALESGLVYDDLKTAFAAPSLAVSRKVLGR